MHECKTVTLRTRPLKGRMLSFYLDYYPGYRDKETMKVIRHETLGIYLYADPKNKREQNFNEVMTEKAEAIRCRRFESVVNERYDFFDKYKLKADFLEYFRSQLRKHDPKWEFVYLHFRNFVHRKFMEFIYSRIIPDNHPRFHKVVRPNVQLPGCFSFSAPRYRGTGRKSMANRLS